MPDQARQAGRQALGGIADPDDAAVAAAQQHRITGSEWEEPWAVTLTTDYEHEERSGAEGGSHAICCQRPENHPTILPYVARILDDDEEELGYLRYLIEEAFCLSTVYTTRPIFKRRKRL